MNELTVDLRLGDCLEVMKTLPDGCVDAIVTDPPYGTGAWKRPNSGAGSNPSATLMRESWDKWDTAWLRDVPGRTVGFFLPQTNLVDFRRLFLWVKTDPRPRFQGQPAYGFEPFAIWRGTCQPIGGIDWIAASAPRENRDVEACGHPHQKPLRVMRWLVSLCCAAGDTVLDPFMGSGTTGVACVQTGRNFIGIEINESYYRIAEKRIEEAQLQMRMEI